MRGNILGAKRPLDVGGDGDVFFKAASHQLCGTPDCHFGIRDAGIQYLRDHPEELIESNVAHAVTFCARRRPREKTADETSIDRFASYGIRVFGPGPVAHFPLLPKKYQKASTYVFNERLLKL